MDKKIDVRKYLEKMPLSHCHDKCIERMELPKTIQAFRELGSNHSELYVNSDWLQKGIISRKEMDCMLEAISQCINVKVIGCDSAEEKEKLYAINTGSRGSAGEFEYV